VAADGAVAVLEAEAVRRYAVAAEADFAVAAVVEVSVAEAY
jgi:hypothetical protein